ncbi:MAG: dienelactone hydrolase family protein [Anaerolineales bacterium]
MQNELKSLEVNGWVMRIREPQDAGLHPVILLLHGWTGDENAMWIFAERLPTDHLIIAPRAPYKTPLGGYGWYPTRQSWPEMGDFISPVESLIDLMDRWPDSPAADFSRLRLAGFSQGAALAYAFSILHPERVSGLAGLAGFLPEGSKDYIQDNMIQGVPVFISHGKKDKLVPIERARQAVETLKKAGAEVTYCEHDVGHKLNAECFRGMEVFFN